jgi:hypothetical protein
MSRRLSLSDHRALYDTDKPARDDLNRQVDNRFSERLIPVLGVSAFLMLLPGSLLAVVVLTVLSNNGTLSDAAVVSIVVAYAAVALVCWVMANVLARRPDPLREKYLAMKAQAYARVIESISEDIERTFGLVVETEDVNALYRNPLKPMHALATKVPSSGEALKVTQEQVLLIFPSETEPLMVSRMVTIEPVA